MSRLRPSQIDLSALSGQRIEDIEQRFPALHLTRSSRFARRLGRLLVILISVAMLAALFVPWQQTIRGEGAVVAFDPFERPQLVLAQVKGRIASRGEGVFENAYVEQGDLLFEIVDQDPQYLFRLEAQARNAESELSAEVSRLAQAKTLPAFYQQLIDAYGESLAADRAAQSQLDEANAQFVTEKEKELAAKQAKVRDAKAKLALQEADFERKRSLFKDQEIALVSQLKFQEAEQKYLGAQAALDAAKEEVLAAEASVEGKKRERRSKWEEWESKINKATGAIREAETKLGDARIKIDEINGKVAEKRTKLQKAQRDYEVQKTQKVTAPRSGYIMNLAVVDGMPIKAGDQLCRIVPKTEQPAVQIWVAGNDAPLIHQGDHVRLQFEGWPAVQFSGWPSVAVGTFGGQVALVDPTDDGKGKFRVLVKPDATYDRPWPEHPYLRQGVRANGWVLLDQVPIGYEIWRRMNGFPPSLQDIEADAAKSTKPPKIKI